MTQVISRKLKSVLINVLLIGIMLSSNYTYSQLNDKFAFEYIDVSHGLSNNFVSKIITDEKGIVWFASEGGINIYDGKDFNILRPGSRYKGLQNENIETLFKDSKGKIWVGTKSGGLSCYDPQLDSFTNYNDLLFKDNNEVLPRITAIEEDKDGNIWIASWGNGVLVFSTKNNIIIHSFIESSRIADIVKDEYGNMWLSSYNHIYKYSYADKRLITLRRPIGTPMDLFMDTKRNILFLGSSDGLFRFNIDTYEINELEESIKLNFSAINSINIDAKDRMWVGSWSQGLFVSNTDQNVFEKFPLSPAYLKTSNYETVLDIFFDQYGITWIATGYGGVVKINPDNSIKYTTSSFTNNIGLPDNNIQSIFKDSFGNIWCGTWSGGIGYSTDGEYFKQLPGIEDLKVSCFFQSNDTVFVGTTNGIFIYDLKNPVAGPLFNILEINKIKAINIDSQKRLWVGTQQRGLYLYDYDIDKKLSEPIHFSPNVNQEGPLQSNRISAISEDQNGNLWIGTYNGLYLFNQKDSTFIRKDQPSLHEFPSVVFLSVFAQDIDTLWIGVPGGLLKVLNTDKTELIKSYNTSQGLKNDYITAVTMDNAGNIWMSNAAGLATLRRQDDVIINIKESGEQFYSMNINSFFNDGEKLFFGGSNGMLSFDPMQVNLTNQPPEIVFTGLRVDNREVNVGEEIDNNLVLTKSIGYTNHIELSYRVSVIALSFITTDYRGERDLHYYYRIKGLQDEWIDHGNNGEISFIGLGSGDYILEIKSTRDKINFGDVKEMKISITTPPWATSLAFVVYFAIAFAIILFIRQTAINRTRLESNLKMVKLTKEKEHDLYEAKLRFYTNVSHELRTPLTLIVSPISEILKDSNIKEGIRKRLNYIESNAKRLLDLINQLLDFRKADHGLLKLQVSEGDFTKFAENIFMSFNDYASSVKIQYRFACSNKDIPLTYDRDKMEIVLRNLLSNAFKFTPVNGTVAAVVESTETHCVIRIKDSGRGISKEYQDKVFDRFFQIEGDDSSKNIGTGIGLSLTKKIVELHQGVIEVKSKKGTEFIIKIPLGGQHFKQDDFMLELRKADIEDQFVEVTDQEIAAGDDTMVLENEIVTEKILVIDDNTDIRNYLETVFEEEYDVITAENGVQGKDIAEETIPDLIICDIMMPEMDGLEMTRILKSQISTSHIPIILLTAKTSKEHEIEGLNVDADDYIKKPFDVSVIKSRIASQLANRKKVRSYLLNKVRFEPDQKIEIVDFEEQFIDNAVKIVEEHLDDHLFDVPVLSDKLCMSQSTLYRKIKSLTGLSIAGFIRSVRLKKASEILLTEDQKLSAVAYMVGFNDYKYFKKSFTSQFGISPKEFQDEQRHKRSL
ncbi:MAG: two-component regulator propeller domain-containing protein [Bacteroidota bacterium]